MNNSLVSIIVPIFNCEKYLQRCLDSLINQTYNNIEIVCVNDGSRDNSLNILNEYVKKDSRVRAISQENSGLSVARNTGLKNANGEYIYFCDSDDYIDKNTIEKLLNFLIKNHLDFVEGKVLYEIENDSLPYSNLNKDISCVEGYDEIMKFYLSVYMRINAWSKLIRKDLLLNNNITFIPGQISEDYIWLFLRLLPATKRIGYCNDGCYHYIKTNNGTITQKHSENHLKSYLDIYNTFLKNDTFMTIYKDSNSFILLDLLFNILIEKVALQETELTTTDWILEKINEQRKNIAKYNKKRRVIFFIFSKMPKKYKDSIIKKLFFLKKK